jgi:hypothetical protein
MVQHLPLEQEANPSTILPTPQFFSSEILDRIAILYAGDIIPYIFVSFPAFVGQPRIPENFYDQLFILLTK